MYGSGNLLDFDGEAIHVMILIAGGFLGLYISAEIGPYGMHLDTSFEPYGLFSYMRMKVDLL